MRFIGIIPARYHSSRFLGKPLCRIGEKTMIEHVYSQVSKVSGLERIIVATDHLEIEACVKGFGGEVCMTAPTHRSGTDRCAEVFQSLSSDFRPEESVVINIQGDEPFIDPGQVREIMECMSGGDVPIATLVQPIADAALINNPNVVKCVRNIQGDALYFSRFAVPYLRNEMPGNLFFYKHIGMYAYRGDVLDRIVRLPVSALEKAESLEQLRWLENGCRILTRVTNYECSIAIDTPGDLQKAIIYEQQIRAER